ncbi:MAG: DUF6517 family protein [Euryarchaeota archaeon]|nr:DUF6517 family protein [Euryarchaeota archaeon]
MNRRALLAGTAAAGMLGVSGCLSGVLGTVTSLESTPAGVSESALDSTGYAAVGIEEIVTEETVEVAGQSETIAVTSYLSNYEKQVGIEGLAQQATATFAVLSTPKLEIAGRTMNPVGEMSGREVVELIGDNYESIDGIEHDSDETITILDQSTTKSRFVAEANFSGLPLELDIHVTEAVDRGDDLLVAIGVYPRQFRMTEGENARTLAESITAEPTAAEAANGTETGNESADTEPTNSSTEETESTSDESDSNESDGLLDVTDRLA